MSFFTPIRGRLKFSISSLLSNRVKQPELGSIAIDQINSAVIIRPNTRIGNTLFLLPMLNALAEAKAGRWIDLIVGNVSVARDLFADHPVVRDIINLPRFGHCTPAELMKAWHLVRREELDLIIDPTPNSTSGRLLLAVARSRFKLGFVGTHQWVGLSHPVPLPAVKKPAWREPLELLRPMRPAIQLHRHQCMKLSISAQQSSDGNRLLSSRLKAMSKQDRRVPIIGFFSEARGKKRLSRDWWSDWVLEMQQQTTAHLVQIVPEADMPPVCPSVPTVHSKSLKALAALISNLDLFVSCDTGPMHLAAAVQTPTCALFSHTNPGIFGPRGVRDQTLIVDELPISQLISKQIEQIDSDSEARKTGRFSAICV